MPSDLSVKYKSDVFKCERKIKIDPHLCIYGGKGFGSSIEHNFINIYSEEKINLELSIEHGNQLSPLTY